jgi:hypothetical protein
MGLKNPLRGRKDSADEDRGAVRGGPSDAASEGDGLASTTPARLELDDTSAGGDRRPGTAAADARQAEARARQSSSMPAPSTVAARRTEAQPVDSGSEYPKPHSAPRSEKPVAATEIWAHTPISPRGYVRLSGGRLFPAWWAGPPGRGASAGEKLTWVPLTLPSDLPEAAIYEVQNERAIAVIRPGQQTAGRANTSLL